MSFSCSWSAVQGRRMWRQNWVLWKKFWFLIRIRAHYPQVGEACTWGSEVPSRGYDEAETTTWVWQRKRFWPVVESVTPPPWCPLPPPWCPLPGQPLEIYRHWERCSVCCYSAWGTPATWVHEYWGPFSFWVSGFLVHVADESDEWEGIWSKFRLLFHPRIWL